MYTVPYLHSLNVSLKVVLEGLVDAGDGVRFGLRLLHHSRTIGQYGDRIRTPLRIHSTSTPTRNQGGQVVCAGAGAAETGALGVGLGGGGGGGG